jgi:hypothetical protein
MSRTIWSNNKKGMGSTNHGMRGKKMKNPRPDYLGKWKSCHFSS